jgi:xanthine dehydrogenase accessory factor
MVDLADDIGSQFDWPFFGLAEDVRDAAAAEFRRGRPIALATLVSVVGGAPRPLGSRMLTNADGVPAGYVSGGCVEGAAAEWAKDVIATGRPRRVALGAGSPFVDIQLPCGGAIELFIEKIEPDDPIVGPWLSGLADRRERWWFADLDTGARAVVEDLDGDEPRWNAQRDLARGGADAAREGAAFVRREAPRLRLALIGGDPVTLALAQLAGVVGAETILIRDRGPREGPPGLKLAYVDDDPATALRRLGVDRWTAVVSTTHDAGLDEGALAAALRGGALYVGALGSRRRAPERRQRLAELGLDQAEIARVRSPVGLRIGAASPYEIAIAILADIVRVRRRGEAADDLVER